MFDSEFLVERETYSYYFTIDMHGINASFAGRRANRLKAGIECSLLFRKKFIEISKNNHWKERSNTRKFRVR